MAMNYLGDFTTSNTVYVYFNTFDSNDPSASVTLTGLAVTDIEIYKNGSITQRSSDAGYTLLDTDGIDFDGTTGIHGFSVDLSDNTDAGFYAAGGEYVVVVASVTVDAATVNFVAASFSIERAGGALALIKAGNLGANVTQWNGSAVATPSVAGVPEDAMRPKELASSSFDCFTLNPKELHDDPVSSIGHQRTDYSRSFGAEQEQLAFGGAVSGAG